MALANRDDINPKNRFQLIDDAMAQILLTRHFLAAQGVPIPTTKIYQDSKHYPTIGKCGIFQDA